jgi:hypothetical protein
MSGAPGTPHGQTGRVTARACREPRIDRVVRAHPHSFGIGPLWLGLKPCRKSGTHGTRAETLREADGKALDRWVTGPKSARRGREGTATRRVQKFHR